MSKLSQSALPHHWSDWFQCRQFYELGIFLREITSASCSCIWRSKFILLCKRYGKVHHTPLENIPGCLPFFSRPWARRWRTIHKCLDAWPVRSQTNVYIPSRRASLPVGWYQLFCLVTEPHVCKQLAQGCIRQRGGWDLNQWPVAHMSSTRPPSHTCYGICSPMRAPGL